MTSGLYMKIKKNFLINKENYNILFSIYLAFSIYIVLCYFFDFYAQNLDPFGIYFAVKYKILIYMSNRQMIGKIDGQIDNRSPTIFITFSE